MNTIPTPASAKAQYTYIRRHHKSPSQEISIYGVEKMSDTLRLCRMNLAVHGLSGDLREANSYYDDPHKLIGRFASFTFSWGGGSSTIAELRCSLFLKPANSPPSGNGCV